MNDCQARVIAIHTSVAQIDDCRGWFLARVLHESTDLRAKLERCARLAITEAVRLGRMAGLRFVRTTLDRCSGTSVSKCNFRQLGWAADLTAYNEKTDTQILKKRNQSDWP